MPPHQKEGRVAIERATGVSQDDRQLRKVDGHVVDRHRIGEYVARFGKDRRPGVEHDRHAALLALAVDLRQLPQLAAIAVWREELMGRVDLDHSDAEVQHAPDLVPDVDLVQGVDRPDGNAPCPMTAGERGDPVVDLAGEAHDVGRDVVDAAGPIDSLIVEKAKQGRGRGEYIAGLPVRGVVEQDQHVRLDHLPRLDMDMNVEVHDNITSRIHTAVDGHASWNSRELRSCG